MTRPVGRSALAGVAVLALVVGACSGDDDDAASTTTGDDAGSTATSAPTTSGSATTEDGSGTGAGTGAACAGAGSAAPAGANTGEVADLDGDGRRDTVWMAATAEGGRTLGVTTAAGGGSAVDIESASPQALRVLVVDADERPPTELFVSDGRGVLLYAFADCAVAPVTNPEGRTYAFDLGLRGTGTGVGCVEAGGGRRLVGLNVTSDDGTTVAWSRTVIELDGLSASNGATDRGTFTHGPDGAAIELLHGVSCGDLTMAADGIQQPEL
jgi:hypothetical protein